MTYFLQTNSLSKRYGNKNAVTQMDIHVNKGDIYGIIGPNGAGKTTLMKLIAGFSNPTSGSIELGGGEDSQRRIGCLIENPGLYTNMNAYDNMRLKAKALGVYAPDEINSLIELVGLGNDKKMKIKHYSLGMKQRLGIALALIGHPDVLILDEPINGLDPQGIIEIRELIYKLNSEENMTILISSHILEELSKVATRFAIIEKGRLILETSAEDLRKRCGERVEIHTKKTGLCTTVLESMGIMNYSVENGTTIFINDCPERVTEITKELVNNSVPVISIGVNSLSLEEFFLNLIKKEV